MYHALIGIRPGYEARGLVNFGKTPGFWLSNQVVLVFGFEFVHIDVALNSMILFVSTCTCFINHALHLIFVTTFNSGLLTQCKILLDSNSFHQKRFLIGSVVTMSC